MDQALQLSRKCHDKKPSVSKLVAVAVPKAEQCGEKRYFGTNYCQCTSSIELEMGASTLTFVCNIKSNNLQYNKLSGWVDYLIDQASDDPSIIMID